MLSELYQPPPEINLLRFDFRKQTFAMDILIPDYNRKNYKYIYNLRNVKPVVTGNIQVENRATSNKTFITMTFECDSTVQRFCNTGGIMPWDYKG